VTADRALVCETAALRAEARGAEDSRAPTGPSSSEDDGVGASDAAFTENALARAALLRGADDTAELRRVASAASSAANAPALQREPPSEGITAGALRPSCPLPQLVPSRVGKSGAFSSLSRIRLGRTP
jgi:hypothetical protein